MFIMIVVNHFISRVDRDEIDVALRTPKIVRDEQEAKRCARRGWVGFMMLPNAPRKLSVAERLDAAARLDFDALQMEDPSSNWAPTIYGITTHASKLEHCWLIGSYVPGVENSGSRPYIPVLVAYLQQRKGLQCQFHYGDEFSVPVEADDAVTWKQTYDCVRDILRTRAPKAGLKPRDVVVDITTATRSMVLGMALTCLSRDRDIQLVGTHYDGRGKPKGTLATLLYSFEPERKD